MTQQTPFLIVVAFLTVAGLSAAVFRNAEYGIPFLPGTEHDVWQVEARIEFEARGGPTQAVLTLPPQQSGFDMMQENAASSGYGFVIEEAAGQRRGRWSKREASGAQTLFYKVDLVRTDTTVRPARQPPVPQAPNWDEPYRTAARHTIELALPLSADALTLAQQLIRAMTQVPRDQNIALLLDQYNPAELLSHMLHHAEVPSRTVQALRLQDGRRRQQLLDLVQVWQDGDWHLVDPIIGPIQDTTDLLLWQTATPSVLDVIGGASSRVSFSIIKSAMPRLQLVAGSPPPLASLYALPTEEQNMFQLIMLLPIGAFVVVFMRVLVGVKTAGTFMPVLIALAFVQTELVPGVVSFVLVVAIGLLIRGYLSTLNLLLVARIAVLIVLVIGIISVFSVVSYRLGLLSGLTITFFPMIILAWTIERMSIVWEEEGPREVLVQGSGSLFVAVLSYLLMTEPLTRHLAFNFPELHLVVLALIMLCGRYTGYRLTELSRFRSMAAQSGGP